MRRAQINEHRNERLAAAAKSLSERYSTSSEAFGRRALEVSRRVADNERRAKAAEREWEMDHKEALQNAKQLVPIRKRLAAAKRAFAVSLVNQLQDESDEVKQQWVRYRLAARDAREEAWGQRVEMLLAAHEEDAVALSEMRCACNGM